MRAVSTGAEQGMSLSFATANVLTLHPAHHTADAVSARRIFLEDQFHQRGLHIVGLQETRSREAHKRLGRRYLSVVSAADPRGGAGVEIWLHGKLGLVEKSVVCLHAEPRIFVVTFDLLCGPIMVVCAHAPCAPPASPEQQVREWWSRFIPLVGKFLPRGAALITLIDANATMGSVTSPFVGDCEPEQLLLTGGFLHDYFVTADQAAPSTFSGGGPTWRSVCSGRMRRIDIRPRPARLATGRCQRLRGQLASGLLALDCDNEDHRLVQLVVHVTLDLQSSAMPLRPLGSPTSTRCACRRSGLSFGRRGKLRLPFHRFGQWTPCSRRSCGTLASSWRITARLELRRRKGTGSHPTLGR